MAKDKKDKAPHPELQDQAEGVSDVVKDDQIESIIGETVLYTADTGEVRPAIITHVYPGTDPLEADMTVCLRRGDGHLVGGTGHRVAMAERVKYESSTDDKRTPRTWRLRS